MSNTKKAEKAPEVPVEPEEHASVTEDLDPSEGVADPGVPNDVEVAARSADNDEPSDDFVKSFVLAPGVGSANPYTEAKGFDHEPNKVATRQYAINAGVWPTGDVTFLSAKRHPDGVSWMLSYGMPGVPATDAQRGVATPTVVESDEDEDGPTNHAEPEGEGDETAE